MQSRLDPNSADSLKLSFDGPLSAFQFFGNFGVRGSLELEQNNLLQCFVGKRVEQLDATFGHYGQFIGRQLLAIDLIDPDPPQFDERGFTSDFSSASLLPTQIAFLCGNLSRRDNGQQTPKSVAIRGFKSTIGQTVTQTVKRTVCRILFVIVPTGLHVEFLCGELLQSHGNVLPQLLGGLLILVCKLVNPARNCVV